MAIDYKHHKYFLLAFGLMISGLWAGEEVKDTLKNNNTITGGKYWFIPPPINVIHNSDCEFYGKMNGYYTNETLGVDCGFCGGLNIKDTIQQVNDENISKIGKVINTDDDKIPNGSEMLPDIDSFVPIDQPARPRGYVRPEYPELSRRMEYTGTAYIKMLVDLDGSVMKVVLIKSSDFPELDSAAVEAAYKWTFSPAIFQDKPVRVWVSAPIKFELE